MFKTNKEKQANERKTFKEFISDSIRGFKQVLLCFFFYIFFQRRWYVWMKN